ncbi:MAG: peptidylprolyl isomerase [Saprospiraceae bacterium]
MKRSIYIILLLFICSGVQAQKQLLDRVIATVGGEIILLSEVEEQFSYMKSQQPDLPTDTKCMIIDNLLLNSLLLNQSKRDSLIVSDEEVDNELNARVDQILSQMNNDVTQFESYYGQTVAQVKEQFRDDLRNKKQIEKMRIKITEGMAVTPSEVQAFFKSIPRDSLPYFNSEVEISEIVVTPKANNLQKKITSDKLADLRARIEKGESFATLAEKYSDDPMSARVGGDLGWAKRGTFVPAFEGIAFKLEKDEISDVFESEFGFHVIQLLERRGNSIHARHILLKPEVTQQDLDLVKTKLDSVRTIINDNKVTFSQAVKEFSDKTAQSYHNDGRMVNQASGNTFFETRELDPDIYFATESMKISEISKPIEARTGFGETQYRLVKLNSRTDPHKANLKQDYNKIQQSTLESKKNSYINEWLMKKVSGTYITVDPVIRAQCSNVERWLINADKVK